MGLPAESFIWLRNAGNIITGPLSSMMRSISLACAIKGGREIVMIGHTDCQVCRTGLSELTEKFKALGVARDHLPQDLFEYFGVFSNERDNVIRAVEIVRHSPLISPKVPVQGLMVDVVTGKLEWVVNGYEALDRMNAQAKTQATATGAAIGNLSDRIGTSMGEIKYPDVKIGEVATEVKRLFNEPNPAPAPSVPPPLPAKPAGTKSIPVPPPIHIRPGGRNR